MSDFTPTSDDQAFVPKASEKVDQHILMQSSPSVHQAPQAKRRPQKEQEVFAALDLGTNNCRLLLARRNAQVSQFGRVPHFRAPLKGRIKPPFRIVEAYSRIVRLGQGLNATGKLSSQAIDRTIETLKVCAKKINTSGSRHVRCVATEACRSASNCDEFLEAVKQETGLELELIDGREEAYLGLLGCAPLLTPRRPHALIFDIGGGSTEISWIRVKADQKPIRLDSISLPFGVVTLSEAHSSENDQRVLDTDAYASIRKTFKDALSAFAETNGIAAQLQARKVQMVGTSGTVTTLSSIVQGLERYDRQRVDGSYLTFEAIDKVCSELKAMSPEQRASIKSIGQNRSDLVLPGCAILEGILDQFPIDRLRIADRGLREGMLYQLMERSVRAPRTKPDVIPTTKKKRQSRRQKKKPDHASK